MLVDVEGQRRGVFLFVVVEILVIIHSGEACVYFMHTLVVK